MRDSIRWLAAAVSVAPLIVATAVVAAPSQGAVAVATTLHSNPDADDNIRLYVMLEASSATLSLNSAEPSPLEAPSSVMFTRLPAGTHRAVVSLPPAVQASLDFTLAFDQQIESKGRRWWCLAAGQRAGQLRIVQLDAVRCKNLADAAPD